MLQRGLNVHTFTVFKSFPKQFWHIAWEVLPRITPYTDDMSLSRLDIGDIPKDGSSPVTLQLPHLSAPSAFERIHFSVSSTGQERALEKDWVSAPVPENARLSQYVDTNRPVTPSWDMQGTVFYSEDQEKHHCDWEYEMGGKTEPVTVTVPRKLRLYRTWILYKIPSTGILVNWPQQSCLGNNNNSQKLSTCFGLS